MVEVVVEVEEEEEEEVVLVLVVASSSKGSKDGMQCSIDDALKPTTASLKLKPSMEIVLVLSHSEV